ncbi:MAG: DUF4194 domain-containing protein [Acidimicrobiia bacterium]|nr:DUF4194 domain-containing protein [Acidimicrobiia bacterium]
MGPGAEPTAADSAAAGTSRPDDVSLVVIQLFKGPLYRDAHEKLWEPLSRHRRRVADHVAVLGLRLEIDETDGYAFLRSLRDGESEVEYPRLVARHSLSFTTSLLIALLRKRLLEFDTSSTEVRLVLSRDQIIDLYRVYAPPELDDVKLTKLVDSHIKRIEELGFLHKLRGTSDQYEVRRIIRAFVDGQWLGQFDQRLREYVNALDPSGQGADGSGQGAADGSAQRTHDGPGRGADDGSGQGADDASLPEADVRSARGTHDG